MSTARRIVSGNLANVCRTLLNFAAQIALVPILLSHWSKTTYGIWLAIQAYSTMVSLADYGIQTFVENECLRLGPERRSEIRVLLWSMASIEAIVGLLEIVGTVVLCLVGGHLIVVGAPSVSQETARAIGWSLCIYMLPSGLFMSPMGVMGRTLVAFSYYSKLTWWSLGALFVAVVVPALAAGRGGDLLHVAVITTIAVAIFNLSQLAVFATWLKREHLLPCPPDWRLGWKTLCKATAYMYKFVAENLRQTGARLLLGGIIGASANAAFTTLRTAANVMLQGIGTITGPIMPELLRYLRQRDQGKMEATFAIVWMLTIAILGPGALLFQWVAPFAFHAWTRGKIGFDAPVFALITASVSFNALGLPGVAVVQGNNLLAPQMKLSTGAIIGTIIGFAIFTKLMGLSGAALTVLLLEAALTFGYAYVAANWLARNEMKWPTRCFVITALGAGIATVAGLAEAYFPRYTGPIVVVTSLILGIVCVLYWRSTSEITRHDVQRSLERLYRHKR